MLFLDTTILAGAADSNDDCHEDAQAVFKAVATGQPGVAFTSDYVLDETLTLLTIKRGIGAAKAVDFVRRVMSSPRVKVITADADDFRQALADYPQNGALGLSFTDAMSLAIMNSKGCTLICSHDTGFDKVKGIERAQTL
jgi:uncharacterized protein